MILEIYNPATDKLVTRWDIDIVYGWSDGDGSFWTDTEQLKYAIKKAGLLPSQAKYKLMLDTKPGRPDVEGGAAKLSLDGWNGQAEPRLDCRTQRPGGSGRILEATLMLSIDEAFRKFKSRLELNEREQKNASQRQNEVRDYLQTKFGIARSFLTGSYARYTKTKPLKDIDIFFVLKDSEKHYHGKAASVVLDDFHSALVEKYGSAAVRKQARSINVGFRCSHRRGGQHGLPGGQRGCGARIRHRRPV